MTDLGTHRLIVAAASGGLPALVQCTESRAGLAYASNGRTWWLMAPGAVPPGTCTATPDQSLAHAAGLVLWEELPGEAEDGGAMLLTTDDDAKVRAACRAEDDEDGYGRVLRVLTAPPKALEYVEVPMHRPFTVLDGPASRWTVSPSLLFRRELGESPSPRWRLHDVRASRK